MILLKMEIRDRRRGASGSTQRRRQPNDQDRRHLRRGKRVGRAYFQTAHGLALGWDVGKLTWPELAKLARVAITDVVDAEDPNKWNWQIPAIQAAVGPPHLACMSNGVAVASAEVMRAYPADSIVILRFHSHRKRQVT